VGHHEGAMIGIDAMSHFGGHTVRTFEQTEPLVVIESAGKMSNSGRKTETESDPIRTLPTSVRALMAQITFAGVGDSFVEMKQLGSETLDLIDDVGFLRHIARVVFKKNKSPTLPSIF
jgi:hypothetical protein